jgi:hypothetical protein
MKSHCCTKMSEAVAFACERHSDSFDCPDCLVHYTPQFDEYGLIVHDGGVSSIVISYCPWCGERLPESKRGRWHDELTLLGFDDPTEQEIPERFKSEAWYA